MARRRGVEDDEVGRARPLELLDLAQQQDVLDARGGGRHHVERTGGHQPLGQARQAMVPQVLQEGGVGRQRAGPHVGGTVRSTTRRQHHLVVAQLALAEHGRQPGSALDLDDQGRQAGQGGGVSQRGADRRFADPALPGHDDQPRCTEELFRIHCARRPPGAVRAVRRTVPKLAALLVMAGALALASGPAGAAGAAGSAGDSAAQADCAERGNGPVAVVEVDGLLDPVLVDLHRRSGPRRRARLCGGAGASARQRRRGRLGRRARRPDRHHRRLVGPGRRLDRAIGKQGRRRVGPPRGGCRRHGHRPRLEHRGDAEPARRPRRGSRRPRRRRRGRPHRRRPGPRARPRRLRCAGDRSVRHRARPVSRPRWSTAIARSPTTRRCSSAA